MNRLSALAAHFSKLVAFSLFVAVSAMLISNIGWVLLLDRKISDKLYFSQKKAPSGQIIIMALDEKSIRRSTSYPYDRTTLAKAIDELRSAGVQRIFIDSLLDQPKSAHDDDALEKALRRAGKDKVGVLVFRAGGTTRTPKLLQALPRFKNHTTSVTMDLATHADRRIRSLQSINAPGARPAQSWLTGKKVAEGNQLIDFSIDPAKFRIYSLVDIATAPPPASALLGKMIIFGRIADDPARAIDVPVYGKLSRPQIAALAAETALRPQTIKRQGLAAQLITIFGLCTLFGALVMLFSRMIPGLLFLFFVCAWPLTAYILFATNGTMLPIAGVIAALFIMWRKATVSNHGLTALVRKLKTGFFGIDRAALITALDAMPEPAFLFDGQGNLLGYNNAFKTLSFEGGLKLGRHIKLAELFGEASASLKPSDPHEVQSPCILHARKGTGDILTFEASTRAITTSTGPICIAGLKDVTISRARETELMDMAFRDTLTGLHNRRAFMNRLREVCTEDSTTKAVLFIDLDGFKQVNDTLGHEAGDKLLVDVSKRISSLLAPGDTSARLGGDEFGLICHFDADDEDNITVLAQAIMVTLATPFYIAGSTARVGASIGIAYFPYHSKDPDQLLKCADMAMYSAKQNKPAYCVYNSDDFQLTA